MGAPKPLTPGPEARGGAAGARGGGPGAGWADCQRCGLHRTRRRVVQMRGAEPADVLMVGEAPGRSEDVTGRPFVGPSGRILDALLRKAHELAGAARTARVAITNVVACRPCDSLQGPNREPTAEEAFACGQRLQEDARRAGARRVVLIGKVAERYCRSQFPGAATIVHPAFILRTGGESSSWFARAARDLSIVVKEVLDGEAEVDSEAQGHE